MLASKPVEEDIPTEAFRASMGVPDSSSIKTVDASSIQDLTDRLLVIIRADSPIKQRSLFKEYAAQHQLPLNGDLEKKLFGALALLSEQKRIFRSVRVVGRKAYTMIGLDPEDGSPSQTAPYSEEPAQGSGTEDKKPPSRHHASLTDAPPDDTLELAEQLLAVISAAAPIDQATLFEKVTALRQVPLDRHLEKTLGLALKRLSDQKLINRIVGTPNATSGRKSGIVIQLRNQQEPAPQKPFTTGTRLTSNLLKNEGLETSTPKAVQPPPSTTRAEPLDVSEVAATLLAIVRAGPAIDQAILFKRFAARHNVVVNVDLENRLTQVLKGLADQNHIRRIIRKPDLSSGHKSSILIEPVAAAVTPYAKTAVSPPHTTEVAKPSSTQELESSVPRKPKTEAPPPTAKSRHRGDLPLAKAAGQIGIQQQKNSAPAKLVTTAVSPLTKKAAKAPPAADVAERPEAQRHLRSGVMPNYEQWNSALIDFFTQGAPVGSTIYLEVNDRNLELIGRQYFPDVDVESWPDNFLKAVRERLVFNQNVYLDRLHEVRFGKPVGVAFLGVLVLVATRMDRDADQQISERDYFTRLNDALGTTPANSQVKRPKGMVTGAQGEEPLWQAWAAYLRERGFLPTATGGKGAWKYVGYAVSQTLVRNHEKRRLHQLFSERNWPGDLDAETLVSFLRREGVLPSHMKALLQRSGEAAEDVQHALSEVFFEWTEHGQAAQAAGSRGSAGHYLQAGLYRVEHWRSGEPQYALYPRQPRSVRTSEVRVKLPSGAATLQPERPGYYEPVGEVNPADLGEGLRFPLIEHPQLQELVLPARDFWILRADPDTPGAYASLGRPNVGEHFLLLARDGFREDLALYRDAGLLQWQSESLWGDAWWEYVGAMVLANSWDEVRGTARELQEALRPAGGVSVSFSGGLVVPRTGAWLAVAPPQVSLRSFFTEAFLRVRRADEVVFEGAVEPNHPLEIPWRGPGAYQFDVEARGQGQSRIANLLEWAELPAPEPALLGQQHSSWGELAVRGPHLSRAGDSL